MPLTDLICKRAKPRVRGKTSKTPGKPCASRYFDGGGLYLNVSPTGHKSWRQQYRIDGAKRVIVHGPYPLFTLADARVLRDATKKALLAGNDPVAQRRASKQEVAIRGAATVELYATEFYNTEIKGTHQSAKHSKQWLGSLQPLFDKFGNRPLRDVTTADLVAVCAPVIKRVPVTGVRMCQRIRRVFAQALDDKLIDADPAVSLHKNKRLRAPKRGDDNHFAALPWAEVPQFIEALHALPADRIGASARAALEFVVLTATRTQETLLAQWDEFDLTAKTWTIPVARTKTRARHVVPLSDRVMALLAEVRPLSKGEGYVFPSPRIKRRPLSTMALLMAIRRLKYHDRTTAHGFRSSFSTWAYERTNWREEVIESALAHVGGNAVKRAYLRSDFMDDRRALMQSWSDHATGKASAKVVSIKRRTRASANR